MPGSVLMWLGSLRLLTCPSLIQLCKKHLQEQLALSLPKSTRTCFHLGRGLGSSCGAPSVTADQSSVTDSAPSSPSRALGKVNQQREASTGEGGLDSPWEISTGIEGNSLCSGNQQKMYRTYRKETHFSEDESADEEASEKQNHESENMIILEECDRNMRSGTNKICSWEIKLSVVLELAFSRISREISVSILEFWADSECTCHVVFPWFVFV